LAAPVSTANTGSGDKAYDYIGLLLVVVMSALIYLVWTIIARLKSPHPGKQDQTHPGKENQTHPGKENQTHPGKENQTHPAGQKQVIQYWLNVLVRYYLGVTMLSYGMVKIIKLQFPFSGLYKLLEPYGYSSPMGLAWNYMGYSQGYNYFAGIAEALAGLLLLFRRTTIAGALLALMVGAHIMAMNYCFDVPVKLLSSMIVFMAIYLLWDDLAGIIRLLFFHKSVQLAP
jgi:hypothetical protein